MAVHKTWESRWGNIWNVCSCTITSNMLHTGRGNTSDVTFTPQLAAKLYFYKPTELSPWDDDAHRIREDIHQVIIGLKCLFPLEPTLSQPNSLHNSHNVYLRFSWILSSRIYLHLPTEFSSRFPTKFCIQHQSPWCLPTWVYTFHPSNLFDDVSFMYLLIM